MKRKTEKAEKEKGERFKLYNSVRKDLADIVKVTAEFNPEKVVLFGSITNKERFSEHSDIDIGVIGVKKEDFFNLYARLADRIAWAVDLIDLDDDPKFKEMVLEKGEIIYDRGWHYGLPPKFPNPLSFISSKTSSIILGIFS
jgi:predicted nucleotidyltransferase